MKFQADFTVASATQKRTKFRQATIATAMLPAVAALSSMPATAHGAADPVLEEIVVTARYRAEKLQETPIAITALTADAIEVKALTEIADIGAVVPNAFIRRQGTQNGPAPAIGLRGVIQSDFSFSFEPGVAVYIDDVYHGTLLGSSFDLLDLERIEVLRGPQGTLFGKNALGGAIRTVSKKPQGDNTGYAEATYGSSNRLNFKAGYDRALIEDKLFMRVTGLSKSIDGYQDRLDFTCEMIRRGTPELAGIGDGIGADGSAGAGFDGRPDAVAVGSQADNSFSMPISKPGLSPSKGCKIGSAGGENVKAGRVMFRLLAADDLEFNVTADYTRDTSEVGVDDLFFLVPDPDPNAVNSGTFADLYNRSRPDFSAVATYTDLNYGIPYDERFLTGNPYQTYSTFNDPVNGTSFPAESLIDAWGASGAADYAFSEQMNLKFIISHREYDSEFSDDRDHSPIGLQAVYTLAEHEQSTAELQLSGRTFERLDWTLGSFYYDAKTFWGGSPQLLDSRAGAFTHNDTAKTKNFSSFAHLVFDITGNLAVTGGLRYTDESKDYHFDHRPNVPVPADASTADARFDWKIGLDYSLSEAVLLYSQVATGFRSEAFNVRIFTPAQLTNTPIDAEELTSYEVGMKGDWFDNRMRLNLAAFYSDYGTRVILQSATECPPSPDPLIGAFGLTCPNGSPGIPWFYYLNTPAEIRGAEAEMTIRPMDGLTIDGTLGWLNFRSPDYHPDNLIQPEWNASLGAQHQFIVGSGTLTPRLDWFYQGKMTYPLNASTKARPDEILGDHTWGNGRLTYETDDRDWTVSLEITNITDKFFYDTWFGSGATFRTGNPVRPREWALNFRRRFQ